jgi:hypothetical protein
MTKKVGASQIPELSLSPETVANRNFWFSRLRLDRKTYRQCQQCNGVGFPLPYEKADHTEMCRSCGGLGILLKGSDILWSPGMVALADFKLVVVLSVNDGEVKEYTDGQFCTSSSGFGDRIVFVTPATLQCTNWYRYHYDPLHQIRGVNLNYPALRSWFENQWLESCSVMGMKEQTEADRLVGETQALLADIDNLVRNGTPTFSHGISLRRG